MSMRTNAGRGAREEATKRASGGGGPRGRRVRAGALAIAALALLLALPRVASAITITVEPATQVAQVGDRGVPVDVVISGLGDGHAPSLAGFDISLGFDPRFLDLGDFRLGDPVRGDQLDLSGFGSFSDVIPLSPDVINVFELSFDSPGVLDGQQSGTFVLFQVEFDVIAEGTGRILLNVNDLVDAEGESLMALTGGGEILAVPEPGASVALLLAAAWRGIRLRRGRQGPRAG